MTAFVHCTIGYKTHAYVHIFWQGTQWKLSKGNSVELYLCSISTQKGRSWKQVLPKNSSQTTTDFWKCAGTSASVVGPVFAVKIMLKRHLFWGLPISFWMHYSLNCWVWVLPMVILLYGYISNLVKSSIPYNMQC